MCDCICALAAFSQSSTLILYSYSKLLLLDVMLCNYKIGYLGIMVAVLLVAAKVSVTVASVKQCERAGFSDPDPDTS